MYFRGFEDDGRKQFKRIAVSFNLSCCIVKLRELHQNTHCVTNWTGRYVENQRYVFVPKGKVYCLVFLTTDDFISNHLSCINLLCTITNVYKCIERSADEFQL